MGSEHDLARDDGDAVLRDVADEPLYGRPNPAQRHYLMRGITQPGGKLPLFDGEGQHIHPALVRACVAHGWAEPWFGNPMKPDWLVCKLTEKGRRVLDES
jgi:hypothetical protein